MYGWGIRIRDMYSWEIRIRVRLMTRILCFFLVMHSDKINFGSDIFGSRISIFCQSGFITTVGRSFGRERIDFLVKLLLIFLFTSILLQRHQRTSPSSCSLWTFKVIGSHHYIHNLSKRSLLRGVSFFSHVMLSSWPFIRFCRGHFLAP